MTERVVSLKCRVRYKHDKFNSFGLVMSEKVLIFIEYVVLKRLRVHNIMSTVMRHLYQ